MRLVSGDSVESIAELYIAACDRSRRTAAECPSLSQPAAVASFGGRLPVNLRWILVHMIDETDRHTGHLDLLRDTLASTTTPRAGTARGRRPRATGCCPSAPPPLPGTGGGAAHAGTSRCR